MSITFSLAPSDARFGPPESPIYPSVEESFQFGLVERGARIGEIVDWTQDLRNEYSHKQNDDVPHNKKGKSGFQVAQDNVRATVLKKELEMVEGRESTKHLGSTNRGRGGASNARGRGRGNNGRAAGRGAANWRNQRNNEDRYMEPSMHMREDSRRLGDRFETLRLRKLAGRGEKPFAIPVSYDCGSFGRATLYNDALDGASINNSKPLNQEPDTTEFSRSITMEDPILRDLCNSAPADRVTVLATDEVLATMMSAARSEISWHVQFTRFKHFVFVSKTLDPDSRVDAQWVSETDHENPPSESSAVAHDRMTSLGKESQEVFNFFKRQCQTKKMFEGYKTDKSPFPKTRTMFRYRKFALPDYDVIVRSEVDCVQNGKGVKVFGLLEHKVASSVNTWSRVLDSKRSTVMMHEVQRNTAKFHRWILMSYLAGVELMKVGFVSRATVMRNVVKSDDKGKGLSTVQTEDDPSKHNIVGIATNEPVQFATEVSLSLANAWAVADSFIGKFIEHTAEEEQGEAYLIKQPYEGTLDLFEQADDGEYEEGEEDEEEEGEEDEDADDEGEE